jgi:hypothetical protein
MRGLASIFFGRELPPQEVSAVLVVCSADNAHCPQILPMVQRQFPQAHLSYVIPEEYAVLLRKDSEKHLISDLKTSAFRVTREIRSQKYDVTVLMLTGQPIFRKAKLWALFTNYRMLAIYNENLDSFYCGSKDRMGLIRHAKWRLRGKGFTSLLATSFSLLLSPLGFLYLLCFTSTAVMRSRLRTWGGRSDEAGGDHTA